jgi:hypothetical protein
MNKDFAMSCYASSKDREQAIFDYIETLESRVQEFENANEWISVDDRLPLDESDKKLHPYTQYNCLIYRNGHVEFGAFSVGNLPEPWGCFSADNITHWKPITPPKV